MISTELQALARVVKIFRDRIGEDTIGVLIYTGCFQDMSGEKLVELSRQIDTTIANQPSDLDKVAMRDRLSGTTLSSGWRLMDVKHQEDPNLFILDIMRTNYRIQVIYNAMTGGFNFPGVIFSDEDVSKVLTFIGEHNYWDM